MMTVPSQNTPSAQALSQKIEMLEQETAQELLSQETQALKPESASQATAPEQLPQNKKKGSRLGCLLFALLISYPILVVMGIIPMGLPEGFNGVNWKEEVQLHDGSVVLVKRHIIRSSTFELWSEMKEEQLEVLDTNGKALTPKFTIPRKILLLDKTEDGRWFTVVTRYGREWDYCFVYKQYVLENNEWKEEKFDKRLIGRLSNLTWGYLGKLNKIPKLLKLSDKPFGYSDSLTAGGGHYYKITLPIYCEDDNSSNSEDTHGQ